MVRPLSEHNGENWQRWRRFFFVTSILLLLLLTHSLDCLTGDGSLRPPDFTITGHIPGGSCSISPTSISSWRIHVCRGRPRGRFQSSLSSGRTPVWVLTARRSASCAGTDSCRRRTCPNIVIRLSRILLQIGRCLTWSITDTHEIKPPNAEDSSHARHLECFQFTLIRFSKCPGLCAVQKNGDDKGVVLYTCLFFIFKRCVSSPSIACLAFWVNPFGIHFGKYFAWLVAFFFSRIRRLRS